MSRMRSVLALGAVLSLTLAAGGQAFPAIGVPSAGPSPVPAPAPAPARATTIAAEQSGAVTAGRALGLGSGEKLIVKDVVTDADGSTHVRYNRTLDGLRVIGGDLVSHRDRSGKIKGVNWNSAHQVTMASTKPKISLSAAGVAGRRKASAVQQTTAGTKSELVVYSGDASGKGAPTLAYDVLVEGVRADQTPSKLHTILDANSGATLSSFDEIETATGHGVQVGTVSINTTLGTRWAMRDALGNYSTDMKRSTSDTASGTTFTDADNIWGNGKVTDPASAAVDAHYGAGKTFAYFKGMLGRNGIRGNGTGARSRVHFGSGYVNAFWDGAQMTYGDGAANAHPLTEIDVAGHEMTHGVTQYTAGLVGDGEAGGLNEATSDIFGTSVEWYANNVADNPDYNIGEKVNVRGDGKPLRYMDRPSKDGQSPNCWSSAVRALDSHFSAGPLNHWFYLASEGSGAKIVRGVSYNSPTCNGLSVFPIGRDKAAKIWYRTLTTYLTSSNGYAAAREGAIQSAKDLYGATSLECKGIAASFSAIGVAPGSAACIAPTPPPAAGANLLRNPGFESGNIGWSATASVIQRWGATEPARTGTWSARLGGFGSFHDDSISQLVKIPAASRATLSYYVHIATREAPGSPAFDTMTVRAGSKALQSLSNSNAASGYQHKTVDLSAYAGQTIALSFAGAEDGLFSTSFGLDDISLTALTAPGAPTAVSARPGNTQAVVSWRAPAVTGGSTITRYTVTATPGGRAVTTTGTPAGLTATLTGLVNGTLYTFRVSAANAVGTSPLSLASVGVRPAPVAPSAPTGVLATAGNAQAGVSWTAPLSNGGSVITGYTVTATPGGRSATSTGTPAGQSATVTGLTNGTAYRFTVTATNAAGTSAASSVSLAVTPKTVPGAPTAVVATARNAEARVSWTAPAVTGGLAITGYTVTATPGGQTATTTGTPAGQSATVTGLTNGTAYTFTVKATNAAGGSTASLPSVAVTPMTVPGEPTGVVAVAGNGEAVVSWEAPLVDGGSAVTAYTVTSVPDGLTATTIDATTSATVTGLTNGTAYTFTVTATNAAGVSVASLACSAVTPMTVPGEPTGVVAVAGNGEAVVSWEAPLVDGGSAITTYTVTSVPEGLPVTTIDATTSATVTGLTNGTAYTFTVTATNAAGGSAASLPSVAVTPDVPTP